MASRSVSGQDLRHNGCGEPLSLVEVAVNQGVDLKGWCELHGVVAHCDMYDAAQQPCPTCRGTGKRPAAQRRFTAAPPEDLDCLCGSAAGEPCRETVGLFRKRPKCPERGAPSAQEGHHA